MGEAKRFLVGVDGSENSLSAFRMALKLAQKCGAGLQVLYVCDVRKTSVPFIYTGVIGGELGYESPSAMPVSPELKAFYEKVKTDLMTFGQQTLDLCCREAEESGIPCGTDLIEGYPAEIIEDQMEGYDLFFAGRHGEHENFSKAIVGSTIEDVVRRSEIPVMVCPKEDRHIDRVLIPYDQSESSFRAIEFFGGELKISLTDLCLLVVEEEKKEDLQLTKEIDFLKSHGYDPRKEAISGNPINAVPKKSAEMNADLIVLGAHGKHKLLQYIIGSTATHLLRKSPVPILIVY